jgi:hypothetical protein
VRAIRDGPVREKSRQRFRRIVEMAGGNLLMARMESGFGEDRRFMVSARGEYPGDFDMGASSFSVDGGDAFFESDRIWL